MPSPRIYQVVASNGSGPNYDAQISALNDAVAQLQQGLSDEASTRGNADAGLADAISSEATTRGNADNALASDITTLAGQVNTLSEAVNNVEAYNPKVERFTMAGPVTSDLEIELEFTPQPDSVEVEVTTGPELDEITDYTLSGNILTLKASSEIVALLAQNDVVKVSYSH